MLKGICSFVSLAIGLGASATLLLILVLIWFHGIFCFEEENIIIRSLETAMLVFAIAGLGTLAVKTLRGVIDIAEMRKKKKDTSAYNPPGGKM